MFSFSKKIFPICHMIHTGRGIEANFWENVAAQPLLLVVPLVLISTTISVFFVSRVSSLFPPTFHE